MSNKKIRLLYTISNFKTAGSGKVVYDLVANLDTSKFDIEIACKHNDGDFFKIMQSLGIPIHVFDTKTSYRPYYTLLFRVLKIAKFLKKGNYDVVHSWQWSNDWTEAVASKLAGAKWIYTKKAMGFKSKHWRIKSYLADFIITTNNEMVSYFPNKKQQALIPFGIDTSYYDSKNFEVPNSSRKQFNIITVANLVPLKGIEILIQAIHALENKHLCLKILGADDNAYGEKLKTLCTSLNMDDTVVFYGKQMDVRPYIANSDLYVIPTLDKGEGMPMALIEAMSMGIPVLGSDISGVNYVLKDFPDLLFKPSDFESLAAKIQVLEQMPHLARSTLGKDLRQYCLEHFTMSQFILAHENLYEQIAKK